MQNSVNKQYIKTIYHMLLELANGNLAYRIKIGAHDKHFNEIVSLLNEVAEKMQLANYLNPYHNFSNPILSGNDPATVIIQNVFEYILQHLDEPLPSTKQLSKMFGTNEFTLKENFRNILKTSIYQFYNDERLKKSYFLIEQTNIPLKEIAFICGFNEYTNFYKAFRKKYSYPPSNIIRANNDTQTND